jgi:hypothetical protein
MLTKSKSKYIKYIQKAGTLTQEEIEVMIKKTMARLEDEENRKKIEIERYKIIFGSEKQTEAKYWSEVKVLDLGVQGTEQELCKIISSFAGSERNCDIEFKNKDENFRKKLMTFFFNEKSANIDYHICANIHNGKNIVLFYDKQKLTFLVDAFMLHNYFDFTLKNTDIKQILLSLPCQWIDNRPEEEDIIIQMLYGNVEPCVSKDRDVIGTTSIITLESDRWNINENTMKLKAIYETYIRFIYSNIK